MKSGRPSTITNAPNSEDGHGPNMTKFTPVTRDGLPCIPMEDRKFRDKKTSRVGGKKKLWGVCLLQKVKFLFFIPSGVITTVNEINDEVSVVAAVDEVDLLFGIVP